MSTLDDKSTSTPDALDPITVDEVEQALTAAQDGGETTDDGGIPHAETKPAGAVALADGGDPDGGIPHAETKPQGGVAHPNGGIPHAETTKAGGGVAHPNGGIPHAEVVRP
jgi:hypothetical protein